MDILIKLRHPEVKVPAWSRGARPCSLGFNQVGSPSSDFFPERGVPSGVPDFQWRKKGKSTVFSPERDTVIRLAPSLDILPTLLTSALLLSRQLLFYFPEEAHNIIIQVSGQIRLNELCNSRRKTNLKTGAAAL